MTNDRQSCYTDEPDGACVDVLLTVVNPARPLTFSNIFRAELTMPAASAIFDGTTTVVPSLPIFDHASMYSLATESDTASCPDDPELSMDAAMRLMDSAVAFARSRMASASPDASFTCLAFVASDSKMADCFLPKFCKDDNS